MTLAARRIGWIAMTLLAAEVALVSSRYFSMNHDVYFDENRASFVQHPVRLLSHIGGGIVGLTIGPFQFWGRFRKRHLRLHRLLGATYLVATVGFGACGALLLAPYSYGGLSTHVGFGLLALLWLMTGLLALWSISRGRVQRHREWVIRSYALTFAAVTLRIWLPLLSVMGVDYLDAYQTVAWLAWVPNLIVAELYIGATKRS